MVFGQSLSIQDVPTQSQERVILENAEKMGAEVDRCFDPPTDDKGGSSLVMSTGVIGQGLVALRASHYFVAKIIADCLSKRYFVRFQLPLMR